jgi:ligand-binding sensor domain-containing protein/signal transduction histidine kinase
MRRYPVAACGLTALLLGAGPAFALSPDRAISQYVVADWDTDAGLPSNGVHALLQTRDHYLWLGTSAGLVRFDGSRFVVFDARSQPGFGDGVVSSLSEGADGRLNVGTSSAVLRQENGAFQTLPVRTGAGVVSSLLSTRDGTLWIGLLGRPVFRWQDGRATSLTKELGTASALAMLEDGDGTVWIGSRGKGLIRFQGGQFTRVEIGSDVVQALCRDRSGALWIGTPHGLLRREGETLRRFTRAQGLSHDSVSAILEDRDGNLWVGTSGGGINRLHAGRFTSLRARDGLSDDDVRALLEDHEGNVWVGTANGLSRLSDGRFVTFGPAEGLPDAAVSAVAPDDSGGVWIGTASAAVAHLSGGTLTHFRLPGGSDTGAVLVLHQGHDGALWAGADDGRLFRIDGGRIAEQTPAAGKATAVFEEDDQGPIFFLRGAGLARVRERQTIAVSPEASRLSYVYAVHRDRAGTLWLCSALGLGRLRGGELRVFTAKDGLPHDRVRSLAEDSDGSLWLATIGGLARLQGDKVRTVTTEQGLPENHLRFIVDDNLGHLWLASVARIFRLDKQELRDLFDGRIQKVAPLVFDTSDGLRSTETLLSSSPGFRSADGRLWFATARGVSAVDPARVSTAEKAPPVRIESLRVDGRQEADRRYPPGRGETTVEYAALSLRAAGKVRFRYRVEGFDDDWFEAGTARQARFSSLPAGHYRFSVMASNGDGVWNGEPAGLDFEIRPPFHRRPLFYVACLAAVLAAFGAAHRLRLAQVRARFGAVLGERTRIARELHDTLAQSLTGMAMQIEAALGSLPPDRETSQARGHLQRARTMVTAGLGEVRRSIWVLRARADSGAVSLPALLQDSLGQLTSHAEARLTFSSTGSVRPLSPEAERNLLRIAHEAVTNAVRHAHAAGIEVSLHYEEGGVRLHVRDDGQGFDPEATAAETRGDRFGLVGMAERAHVMNGELRVESRPGAGTEIECRLPYGSAATETMEAPADDQSS